jgi:drug/metabolite transporter (DMT)-like permease
LRSTALRSLAVLALQAGNARAAASMARRVSAVPLPIHALSLAMAVFSTVLPTWMIAEAIRRIGANTSSLIGSLGPVFTIALGAVILGESVTAIQLAGAALVLVGVVIVTLRPRATAPA